jgi:hypothetical protein
MAKFEDSKIQSENFTLSPFPSIDSLLDSFGLDPMVTIFIAYFLTFINVLGTGFCVVSAWIFFKRHRFVDPVFFYYRLLCLAYIIHLVHNIPLGVLFSSRYFPSINTYLTSIFQVYYSSVLNLLYHYEDTLQMAILLTKMKHFIPFLKRYFTASPRIVSLALFVTCFCIDFPSIFSLKVVSIGTYYYTDTNGKEQIAKYYRNTTSDFGLTLAGRILFTFLAFFLNLILSLFFGVTLNIIAYVKYKAYCRRKRSVVEQLEMSSIHNRPVVSREIEQINERERREQKIETNMLYMALTLCSLSIISRILLMANFIYFLFYFDVSSSNYIFLSGFSVYTCEPTCAIFVFYRFNQMFRDEFTKRFFFWRKQPDTTNQALNSDIRGINISIEIRF